MKAGSRPRRREGFTLVELLVVVAIIALLVSILLPSLSRCKELARKVVCKASLNALGKGWQMYWEAYDYRTPHMFNPLKQVTDCYSQFNFVIYICSAAFVDGRYEGTTGQPDYVNAGKLYDTEFIGSERTYVCPTVESDAGGNWFNEDNPWPVNRKHHTTMTFGTRRMQNYDDPSLANQFNHYDTRDDNIMIWSTGVERIPHASSFSFMADSFRMPSVALMSHVPGVNVQYLDGHVGFYEDTTGKVLYDNGLPFDSWDPVWNWEHDDIWMIIDGYHSPPVGQ